LIIGIAPCGGQAFGPNADRKRWPPEYFAQLIKRLIQDLGAKIFLFAGPDEKEDIKHIKGLLGDYRRDCYQFTDASLLELIAFVDKCNLIIANDTGPLRFADAMNKKIIALFGPVDEVVYGPYPPGAQRVKVLAVENLPCRPCYRRFRLDECKRNKQCLRDIDSLTVFNEVKQLLQK
jgi:ADP-heptose:LPS heptosyltransferase